MAEHSPAGSAADHGNSNVSGLALLLSWFATPEKRTAEKRRGYHHTITPSDHHTITPSHQLASWFSLVVAMLLVVVAAMLLVAVAMATSVGQRVRGANWLICLLLVAMLLVAVVMAASVGQRARKLTG